jgi:hypothetical protein
MQHAVMYPWEMAVQAVVQLSLLAQVMSDLIKDSKY